MALIFRWFFWKTTIAAIKGDAAEKINFQIHTGPALGAFNQLVKGCDLEDWRLRNVDKINIHLMKETAILLDERIMFFNKLR